MHLPHLDTPLIAEHEVRLALGRLDDASRAVLDLTLRRGLSDGRVGALLSLDADAVAARRDAALDALAAELRVGPAEARRRAEALPAGSWTPGTGRRPSPLPAGAPVTLVADIWSRASATRVVPAADAVARDAAVADPFDAGVERRRRAARLGAADVPAPLPFPAPADSLAARPPAGGRRRRGIAAAGAGVTILAAIALGTWLLAPGSDPAPRATGTAAGAGPAALAEPAGAAAVRASTEPAGLATVVAGPGGTRDVRIDLGGLPATSGVYAAWSYATVIGALPLGTIDAPGGAFRVRIPADPGAATTLDISRQPDGSTARHSGQSILRVPLARLRAGVSIKLVAPPL